MNKRKSHSWMFSLFELRVSNGLGYVLTIPEVQNMKNLTFLSHVGYSWANTLWDCSDKEWKPSKRGECTSRNSCLEMWAEGGTLFLIMVWCPSGWEERSQEDCHSLGAMPASHVAPFPYLHSWSSSNCTPLEAFPTRTTEGECASS